MWVTTGVRAKLGAMTARPGVPAPAVERHHAFMDMPSERLNGAGSSAAYAARWPQRAGSIEAADGTPPLAELARTAGLSPWHFHRVVKATTGVTPGETPPPTVPSGVRDRSGRQQDL